MTALSRRTKIAVLIAFPVMIALLLLFREPISRWSAILGGCIFHQVTGLHCPGCGNTRSAKALLHGHVITAVRNNPAMPFLALTALTYYIETAADILGRPVKLLPRKPLFWWSVLALFLIFYIARNFVPFLAPIPE